jgi:hypothetical protein
VTPEQEEQVRRALAALADSDAVGPMPPEVARRLDGVLADLVAEDATGGERKDELEERRRRRWPKVLVAAAAVAVVAGGTATVLDRGTGADDKASSSQAGGAAAGPTTTGTAGTGPQPEASGSQAAPRGQSFAAGAGGSRAAGAPSAGAEPSARTGRARSVAPATRRRPPLRSAELLHDVQSLVDRGTVGHLSVSGAAAAAALAPCRVPETAEGDHLLAVRLDGRRATLVLSTPVSGRRQARVYGCGDAQHAEATTTVHDRVTSR